MGRKNLLDINEVKPAAKPAKFRQSGPARTFSEAINETAEQMALIETGAMVVELEAEKLVDSFVSDRIEHDDESYQLLLQSIKSHGQATPILVRKHPEDETKYMIVFGHRRARAARELGIKVKAIIRTIEDISHVMLQAQENSVRENLSFLERARFSQQLIDLGNDKQFVLEALSINDATLSQMLTLIERVPEDILGVFQAGKGIGRDKWFKLKTLLLKPDNIERAQEIIADTAFSELDGKAKMDALLSTLNKVRRKPSQKQTRKFSVNNKEFEVSLETTRSKLLLALNNHDNGEFGNYLIDNLGEIYRHYQKEKN